MKTIEFPWEVQWHVFELVTKVVSTKTSNINYVEHLNTQMLLKMRADTMLPSTKGANYVQDTSNQRTPPPTNSQYPDNT
jgi:hypothetical protein